MGDNDYKIMFDLLEWEVEEKIKKVEKEKSTLSKQDWKTKKNIYNEVLEMIRYTQKKGAVWPRLFSILFLFYFFYRVHSFLYLELCITWVKNQDTFCRCLVLTCLNNWQRRLIDLQHLLNAILFATGCIVN